MATGGLPHPEMADPIILPVVASRPLRSHSACPSHHIGSVEALSSTSSASVSSCSTLSSLVVEDQDSPSLEEILASLSIADSEPEQMFRSLEVIFTNAQDLEGSIRRRQPGPNSIWTILQRANTSDRIGVQDTVALTKSKALLEEMLQHRSQLLVSATKVLADASRDPLWRTPLGEAGILEFFVGVTATDSIPKELQNNALRLIGNACADNDENRRRVISNNFLSPLIYHLDNHHLITTIIPVLYNVCNDFEPGQAEALSSGLYPRLIQVLERGDLSRTPFLSYLCRLLDLFETSFNANDSPDNTVEILFRAASAPDLDVDDRISLVDAGLAHLKLERFQIHMVESDLVGLPLGLLLRWYSPQQTSVPSSGVFRPPARDAGEQEELSLMRTSIVQVLSDVSALPLFASRYGSLDSTLIDSLIGWLSGAHTQLQLCSCIMLGNLARSDAICQGMISRFAIHQYLLDILRNNSDTSVLHSVFGFLRNLGLASQNKITLGEANIIEIMARFWTVELMPQLTYAAVSLGRQVINGSILNISKLLTSLSLDEESPASSKTYLSLMFSLFDKSDDPTVKVEIGRIVAAILRCLCASEPLPNPSHRDSLLHRLYQLHPDVAQPLAMMVTQARWPIIRSEGWFALALMARSVEGSAAVDSILQQVEVFGGLEASIRGQSSLLTTNLSESYSDPGSPDLSEGRTTSERRADMQTKDRENAMVMVSEILRNRGQNMSEVRRSVFEDLLNGRE